VRSGIFKQQPVHGKQEFIQLVGGQRGMAAQACLQVRHQQRRCDPFAGNVSNDQRNAFSAQIEKIIVVSAYRPGL